MGIRWNRYLITALFSVATLAAGCAARDVDVSQRGPIRGEATSTSQGDSTRSEREENRRESYGTRSGSDSRGGSFSGSGSGSASGTIR
jgi:hypothetical protein